MSAAEQLAEVEAQMALWEKRHLRALWRWRVLRRKRDTLREAAAELRAAKTYLGPGVRRSA